ncbi:MAG: TetR/AcrR family transcriptional regulator [Eubacteriales bacterium]|nr:TetR/AcrR family transcriptional regulator [Eubacteriales bacterium]
MATAFTEQERAEIERQLRAAALRCAAQKGLRQTTVDELARGAGVSKGAFYSFYPSKEHLFLAMLEELYEEIYGGAERILEERGDLPIRQRTALAIAEVCRVMKQRDMMAFLQNDLPLLLRKLPPETISQHYQSGEAHMERLVRKAGVTLGGRMETVCAVIRLLVSSLINRDWVGEGYDEALQILIDGACDRLVQEIH